MHCILDGIKLFCIATEAFELAEHHYKTLADEMDEQHQPTLLFCLAAAVLLLYHVCMLSLRQLQQLPCIELLS